MVVYWRPMEAIRIQAKFIVVSPEKILAPGQIVVRHGRVAHVTNSTGDTPDLDLGESVLLPGLVNAHTHLEFSDLNSPLPANKTFPDWISSVVTHRREQARGWTGEQLEARRRQAIADGFSELYRTGTALAADIITQPWQPDYVPSSDDLADYSAPQPWRRSGLRVAESDYRQHLSPVAAPRLIVMPEMIGLDATRLDETCNWALQLVGEEKAQRRVTFGVSPHAPYSVQLSKIAETLGRLPASTLTAMHVAESTDELQWLIDGEGAFGSSFERLGIPRPKIRPQIEECIALLASRCRSLLVHGNYLTGAQLRTIGQSPSISVVYCPRTHRHFGHPPFPLSAMLAANIRVVLGTDSRASNPDLSLWSEVLQARHQHPDIAPARWLASVTSEAALALGAGDDLGTLDPGKLAYINAFACRSHWTEESLLEELTSSPPTEELGPIPLTMLTR